mgnify:CR=1 FL=1
MAANCADVRLVFDRFKCGFCRGAQAAQSASLAFLSVSKLASLSECLNAEYNLAASSHCRFGTGNGSLGPIRGSTCGRSWLSGGGGFADLSASLAPRRVAVEHFRALAELSLPTKSRQARDF